MYVDPISQPWRQRQDLGKIRPDVGLLVRSLTRNRNFTAEEPRARGIRDPNQSNTKHGDQKMGTRNTAPISPDSAGQD
ncbi:hypothetical protein O988_00516 [Pseudogymnoascus sp. VKM F-3808]|nr:hypothetical protein O988_00516 [Pseudogymnoascus sp. VKM F-3808]